MGQVKKSVLDLKSDCPIYLEHCCSKHFGAFAQAKMPKFKILKVSSLLQKVVI